MARAEKVGLSENLVTYRGLRDWIEQVDKMGELLRINGLHWDREMGATTQMLTESSKGKAPAVLFDEVPGYPKGFRTLYGQFSSIKRVALTLGLPLEYERKVEIVKAYHERMQNMKLVKPKFVKSGAILDHVLEGDDVDVDEGHRTGELGDRVGDLQLGARRPFLGHGGERRMAKGMGTRMRGGDLGHRRSPLFDAGCVRSLCSSTARVVT